MKKLILLTLIMMTSLVMWGCSRQSPLVIWVGAEVQEFYEAKMVEYVEYYNSVNDSEFPFKIEVRAADTGSAAATFLDDMDAGPDILTVAHDNLGRLISGASAIQPIQNPALLAQIEAQNPETFLRVIKGSVGGQTYTFGVPYEAQALILYYNKAFLNEDDVETWEGIWDVAKANNKRALSITGTDGFNNSFLVLATNAETGETSLRLFEDGVLENTFGLGDDTMSILKWGQRFFQDPNGARQPSDSGWEVDFANEAILSVIGGAWHFRAARASLGDNLGIAVLPQFTITEEDAYGEIQPGTVFQSGTFTDTKMFVMNRSSDKLDYLEDILLFLSHKDVQEQSYIQNNTLPAYKNALAEFSAMQNDDISTQLAVAQLRMFDYGIPQPFGAEARFNVYYYQRGAPDLIMAILRDPDNKFTTDAAIFAEMERVQRIWFGER